MKKGLCFGIGAALLLGIALSASGCGLFSGAGKADDNYPYDIAVQEGYEGTEGEWLAGQETGSTLYWRMWEEAKGDGSFSGTYYEFLQSLNIAPDLQSAFRSVVSVVAHLTSTTGSAGAGIILSLDETSGDMFVITNYHIVYNSTTRRVCTEIDLYLYGGGTENDVLEAQYYGGSMKQDIAILWVKGSTTVTESDGETHTNAEAVKESAAVPAKLGNSDELSVGESVYAIGNPENAGISVVQGVVSVDAEYVDMQTIDGSSEVSMLEIRTDAAVNHGNSGGGLFNAAGELVGIVNARSEKDGVLGFGYAIPVNTALAVANNCRANGGSLKSAKLGISVATEESHSVYDEKTGKLYKSEKIVIQSVDNGSAARVAGLDVGDTFVSATLNGKTVQLTRRYKLTNLLLGVRKGDTLTLVVSRSGKAVTLNVTFDKDSYFMS